MLTLNIPDSRPDLYKLPKEVLTRIRQEINFGDVYLEAGSLVSLFTYDNGTFIVYPYVDEGTQPDTIRIHVKGNARELSVLKGLHNTPSFDEQPVYQPVHPLYQAGGETVFEVRTQPGDYVLYKIEK